MKKTLILNLFLVPFLALSQLTLTWSDEFNGPGLDLTKWKFDIGQGNWGWGNNELQYYTNSISNVNIDTGYLRITAKNESFGPANYTSARIKTKDLFEFKYGRVEARMKVPYGQGLWPALWMLGANIDAVGWPNCGEIDIMEHINNETVIHGTHHYHSNGHLYAGGSAACDAATFQVYSIEWTPNYIKWFLNDVLYYETNISASAVSKEEFHEPFFFLINLAVGVLWPGYQNSTTPFPSSLYVDYIRVYQDVTLVDEISESTLNIYPNPASDMVFIQTDKPIITYALYNLQGELIRSGNENQIKINDLAKGAYWVEVETEGTHLHKKRLLIQ